MIAAALKTRDLSSQINHFTEEVALIEKHQLTSLLSADGLCGGLEKYLPEIYLLPVQ